MKTLLIFILLVVNLLLGCKSQSVANQDFVKVTPENDCMEFMYATGELGYSGTTEVYFISLIRDNIEYMFSDKKKPDPFELKQGFVVVKVQRNSNHFQRNDPAYKLLDSLNECRASEHRVITGPNGWSEEQKKEIIKQREILPDVRIRFYDHVKVYIEKQSLSSGISNQAYLKYE